jgi:Ca2+-transporting ATPase
MAVLQFGSARRLLRGASLAPREPSGLARSLDAPAWHVLTAAQAAAHFGDDAAVGLTTQEAARRLVLHGRNEIREQDGRSVWQMLLSQFADFMILMLLGAAVISGVIGEIEDAAAILAIVVLNAVIGFVQEYRAEKALRALKQLAALKAHCVRDGVIQTVPAAELVPGDLVILDAGSVVPADVRLREVARLKVEEAALTGESHPVDKDARPLLDTDAPLGDRLNMAYSGTVVTYGRGQGIVVATGMETELGHIARLLAATQQSRTPLQRRLARFGKQLSAAAIAICVLVFALGVMRGESVVLMFLTAVSLAVAAVPEALPAVITIGLAMGAQRMVRKNALVRRLPAVETLGSVTYICSDKTGTLTENRMRAESWFVDGEWRHAWPDGGKLEQEPWRSFVRALALNNDATIGQGGQVIGDPTEVALYAAAADAGYAKRTLEDESPRIAELPFDSDRKRMTTLHRTAANGAIVALTKGAPESMLERCTSSVGAHGRQPIDRDHLAAEAERMAADGLRVLAVARRDWPQIPGLLQPDDVEVDLAFLGFVGLIDPPRPEAARAVAECLDAGMTPVMITGDHPLTAHAIAVRLGIIEAGEHRLVTGRELATMDAAALAARARDARVYARVNPEQKIAIVKALQGRGEFVAMTGDGVNDAPALKQANIGIAMGRVGTDVAREASDIVLLDDNFATIVGAVREGRRIYDNIRKFVKFVLAGNLAEILTLLLAPLLGMPMPLTPIQILWVNLVTDGLPGLALAGEPEERGVMRRPPRAPGESLFAGGIGFHVVWVGCLIGALSLGVQAHALGTDSMHWQTMVFTTLTFAQLFHVMVIRSERESLFTIGLGSNLPLLGAVLLGAALQLAVVYMPVMNEIMKTEPLSATELAICVLVPGTVLVAVEVEKWLVRRGLLYRGQLARGAEPCRS